MANKARGETAVEIGGKTYTLSLNLGALAELEDAFGVESFEEALAFDKPSARWLIKFMTALLKGNGVAIDETLTAAIAALDPMSVMTMMTKVLDGSGMVNRGQSAPAGDSRPLAAKRGGKPG